MAIIIHHNDDDGRCAGAIAYRQLVNPFDPRKICYEYSHNKQIDVDYDSVRDGEEVFIVDLSLDENIMDIIRKLHEKNCRITHIDHHVSTVKAMENLSDEDKAIMADVRQLVKIGVSGALLTYVFAAMSSDMKNNLSAMIDKFDFTEERTHFAFFNNGKRGLDYIVPLGIRWIDDYDVWRHQLEETRYFNLGFSMVKDKSPASEVWDPIVTPSGIRDTELLYSAYVDPGRVIFDYQTTKNEKDLSRGFEYELDGVKCLCVNTTGNSFVFGDKIHEYPMACLFYHTGSNWHYSLYSSETSDDAQDVSIIAENHGGGGHKHAAGFISEKFIFEN